MTRPPRRASHRLADCAVAARFLIEHVTGRPLPSAPDDTPERAAVRRAPHGVQEMVRRSSHLTTAQRVAIVAALLGRDSLRATARRTGVARNIVGGVLMQVGDACRRLLDRDLRALSCVHLRLTRTLMVRLKTPSGAAAADVSPDARFSDGAIWMWTCVDAGTGLILDWRVGTHDLARDELIEEIRSRLLQPATMDVGDAAPGRRVTRAALNGAAGFRGAASTFLRASDSHRLAKQRAALALYVAYHNFGRAIPTATPLARTPAMAVGLADRVWTPEDFVALPAATSPPCTSGSAS